MKLVHFSKEIITKVKSRKQRLDRGFKPNGFWVSDEDEYGWSRWCKSTKFRIPTFKYSHLIELNTDHKVLVISNLNEFDEFNEKYKVSLFASLHLNCINWVDVAKDYSGIIITPYKYERRLYKDSNWYYGWDCASGCIWNAKTAIKSIKTELDRTCYCVRGV